MTHDAMIVEAVRTPIGRLSGALSEVPATALGAASIAELLKRADLDPGSIDDVIIGQVLQAGAGQNPARQAAIYGGIPNSVPAMTINQVCGGGQRSLHLAAQAIRAGDAEIIVAGGQDSMTRAPHLLPQGRSGIRLGDGVLKDSMLVDGLIDAFNDVHMGVTAERLASRYQITRETQDRFALDSQRKAKLAQAEGRFGREIVPIDVASRKGTTRFAHDEHVRPDTTAEQLAALKPIFAEDGTVTAGNSSGLNDGAAALLVVSSNRTEALGLTPRARIASYASAALEPMDMGLGPVHASREALRRAGWTVADLDVVEINEAFAAQALAVLSELAVDPSIVNPNGGAIALGHPLAGSGARIVVSLLHEMERVDARKGLAAMCIGGGQGVAICLER